MSAASARLLFDGDDAILHNTVRTPSRRWHRSLPAAAAPFLRGRTLTGIRQQSNTTQRPCTTTGHVGEVRLKIQLQLNCIWI